MKSVADVAASRFESISSIIFIVDFVLWIRGGLSIVGPSHERV